MRIGMLWAINLIFLSAVDASVVSHLKPLGKFSPAPVTLELATPEWIPGASAEFYWRRAGEGPSRAWQRKAPLQPLSATQAIFSGTQGETFDFKSAVIHGNEKECQVIADFEQFTDHTKIGFVGSEFGFRCDYTYDSHDPAEGRMCLAITFQYNLDEKIEFPDKAMIGFPFTSLIPTTDWSPYSFLEISLWNDLPAPLECFLASDQKQVRKSILDYDPHAGEAKQWHTLEIDLSQDFPTPEDRKAITICAFAIPLDALPLDRKYTIRFDGIRLWTNRQFMETTLDATPPSPPSHLNYALKPFRIQWQWDAAQEDVSGIDGYAVLWGTDIRKKPESVIHTATPFFETPFTPPPFFNVYYFQVKARNGAGAWSDRVTKEVEFNPLKKDKPAPGGK